MNRNLILSVIVLLFSQFALFAQEEIRFIASAKQMVEVGERFTIVYEVNGNGSGFIAPKFGKLQILSGPNSSTSSSVQYVNGKMEQSYSESYTYYAVAASAGEINIPPASVVVDGKRVNSNKLKIKVVKSSGASQSPAGDRTQSQREMGVLQDDDVYIRAVVSNKNPYLGEQILVTYRIYTRVPVSNLAMTKSSSFTGFWSKSLTDNQQQLKQSTQIINGEEYIVADIAKYAIFPQKSGKLTIESAELECVVQVRVQQQKTRSNDPFENFFNDPFFNRNMRNVETTLKSNPITINVKNLPAEGKPASFHGAVGNFTFSTDLDRHELTTNDALTLKVNINGRGNLELIKVNEPAFPTDFETYDPKVSSNIKTSTSGVSGSKKFEYLAIPRAPGDFVIQPIEFAYFNPKEKKYHSFTSGDFNIKVTKGEQGSSGITYSSSAQEDIRYIGKDIRHIKPGPFNFFVTGIYFFGSTTYYILLGFPILFLIVFILVWKNIEKKRGDIGALKTRRANKAARTRLLKADKFRKEDNDKAFYEEIAQALWGYIADKFSIPVSSLSIDTVKTALTEKKVNEEVIDNFVNTLNNIEFARFAPGDASGKMENIYNEALNAITLAEKELK